MQKCLAQSGLQPLAAGDLEGCVGDLGTVIGHLGVRGVLGHLVMRVGDCPEPPGVPGAQLQTDSPTHTASVCNVRVCVTNDRNISSATLNPQTRKMPVSVAEIPEIKMTFWIVCHRFFLLQPGKAICIHLISEVLVTGDINFIVKPDKYFTLSLVGNCIPTVSSFVLPDGKDVCLPFSCIQLVP